MSRGDTFSSPSKVEFQEGHLASYLKHELQTFNLTMMMRKTDAQMEKNVQVF